mgnify:CR=1 FL=1
MATVCFFCIHLSNFHAIMMNMPNRDLEYLKNREEDRSFVQSAFSWVACAKRAAPLMKPGGSMVTLTYLGAERVLPSYNVMGVAKAALEACTRYMARDLGPSGLRVNAISAGPMRTLVLRPAAEGRFPGLLFHSEIFQLTAPICRTAATLAGHGFIVALPEIYHEYLPAGTVLGYDQAGSDVGNRLKTEKPVAAYDADNRAVLDYLKSHTACTGRLGSFGPCIGGHLTYRAALQPDVAAAACFYPTDLHKRSLGAGMNDDSMASSVLRTSPAPSSLVGSTRFAGALDDTTSTSIMPSRSGATCFARHATTPIEPTMPVRSMVICDADDAIQ